MSLGFAPTGKKLTVEMVGARAVPEVIRKWLGDVFSQTMAIIKF